MSIRVAVALPAKCPAGWTTVGSRCFKYDGTKRNYADQVKYCKSQGGNAASIHNDAENNAVIKLVKQTAFLGAESDGKGKWKWADGSKWWQPAKTQHDGIVGTGETKIALNTDKKWHDWGKGSDKLSVVCAMTIYPRGNTNAWCFNSGTCAVSHVVLNRCCEEAHKIARFVT